MTPLQIIRETLEATPIIDVHEHHIPDILHCRDVGLLQLLRQSYAGWAVARPYALPSESRTSDPMLDNADHATWKDIQVFAEHCGSNHFVRHLVQAILDLHSPGESHLNSSNWEAIDARIRAAHRQPTWSQDLLRQANLEMVITDPYTDPLLDATTTLGSSYRSVMRINSLACGWHAESRDHNGNSSHELLGRIGCYPSGFDDYIAGLSRLVEGMQSRNQVALKNALAYDRDLYFDVSDIARAKEAWGLRAPSSAQQKAFGDWVVDYLCQLAGQKDLPVQMHLGTAIVRGSHPLNVAPLIERHPGTRFLLMHLAYPWSRDLLGMAFVYRNIWIDLTWSLLLSPSHFKLALHEAIEILPDESRMMIGGDNWHAEETWATMRLARRLIAEVLAEKVAQGYFRVEDALRLGVKILNHNAKQFFRL